MSKRQHQRQLARSRANRSRDRFERRRRRARVTAIVAAGALLLSVFAAVLVNALDTGPEAPAIDDTAVDPDADDDAVDPDADDTAADPNIDDHETADDDVAADDVRAAGACPPADDVAEPDVEEYDDGPEMVIDEDATYRAILDTSCGEITLELDAQGAPLATNNFVFLAGEGFYDGVIFHRVIEGFMIQGGDPTGTGAGGPGYTFADELGPAEEHFEEVGGGYARGRLAMANSGPDTNGSQFFITHGDPAGLPAPAYTLFGEVVAGMDVVDMIASEPTGDQDLPLDPVHIRGIEIEEQ